MNSSDQSDYSHLVVAPKLEGVDPRAHYAAWQISLQAHATIIFAVLGEAQKNSVLDKIMCKKVT